MAQIDNRIKKIEADIADLNEEVEIYDEQINILSAPFDSREGISQMEEIEVAAGHSQNNIYPNYNKNISANLSNQDSFNVSEF